MATIYRIGEQIQKLYGQKVVGSKISRQEAILAASQATNKVLRDLIYTNKAQGIDTIPYECFREYVLPIQKDVLRNKWYAKLPIRTLESLLNNMGIYHVASTTDIDDLFVPLDAGFNSMFKGLDAFQLEGKLGYIPEKDRIYLQGAEFESDFEVFVRLIPDATSLEPDDNIPAPVDMEVNIIQLALQILATQMQVPRDNQNDGV
jgi:hypothetical protein